jgi:hypothetical protein
LAGSTSAGSASVGGASAGGEAASASDEAAGADRAGGAEEPDTDQPTASLTLAQSGDAAATELTDLGESAERAEAVALAEPVTAAEGGRRRQRALIAASFVIAGLAVVIGAIAVVGSLTHGFKQPVQITYKKSAIFSLKTGDCLDPRSTQSYTLVACDQPHDAEVFATFELPAGKWPGTSVARAAASTGCASRLTGYLNPQLAVSLATMYVYPDSVAWQAGTRRVICEVRATSGQLTQSVRAAPAPAG